MKPRGIGNFKDVGERSKNHKVKNCETDFGSGKRYYDCCFTLKHFVDQIVIVGHAN